MSHIFRRILLTVVALTVVAAGGYVLWWNYAASTARTSLDHWIAARAASGWRIETGTVTRSGFPWRIVFSLSAPSVQDPSGNSWQGPPLSVAVPMLDPLHSHLDAPGRHLVTVKGHEAFDFSAETLTVDLTIDSHGPRQAALALAGASSGPISLGRMDVAWTRLNDGPVARDQPSFAASLALEKLAFPDDPRLTFGSSISSARLDGRFMGTLPAGGLEPALAAWRDDGGTIEIDTLSIDWPPLSLTGKGTLALDREMQPMLASSCDIRGLFEAIERLVGNGTIRRKDANIAKLILGLLAKPDRNGAQTLTLPLTIQGRILSVGPVKLFEIPPVVWH